jgi:hypothetical protein
MSSRRAQVRRARRARHGSPLRLELHPVLLDDEPAGVAVELRQERVEVDLARTELAEGAGASREPSCAGTGRGLLPAASVSPRVTCIGHRDQHHGPGTFGRTPTVISKAPKLTGALATRIAARGRPRSHGERAQRAPLPSNPRRMTVGYGLSTIAPRRAIVSAARAVAAGTGGCQDERPACGIMPICRWNLVLMPHTDDAEKLRG